MPCVRLFVAESTNRGYPISFSDVDNAFQQSPPPTIPCYLAFDEPMKEWYKWRFGEDIDWSSLPPDLFCFGNRVVVTLFTATIVLRTRHLYKVALTGHEAQT